MKELPLNFVWGSATASEYASQKRYIKDSGYLYREIIKANGLAGLVQA